MGGKAGDAVGMETQGQGVLLPQEQGSDSGRTGFSSQEIPRKSQAPSRLF
jgi:hypothetical protein